MTAYENVYKVQCKTYRIARELTDTWNNVTHGGLHTQTPFTFFRVVKPYRTPEIQEFRNLVARETRRLRKEHKI